jgi:hypothetical protein
MERGIYQTYFSLQQLFQGFLGTIPDETGFASKSEILGDDRAPGRPAEFRALTETM